MTKKNSRRSGSDESIESLRRDNSLLRDANEHVSSLLASCQANIEKYDLEIAGLHRAVSRLSRLNRQLELSEERKSMTIQELAEQLVDMSRLVDSAVHSVVLDEESE